MQKLIMLYKLKTKSTIKKANSFDKNEKTRMANLINTEIESIGRISDTKNDEEYDLFMKEKLTLYGKNARASSSETFSARYLLLELFCLSHFKGDRENAELILDWVYDNKDR